MLHLASKITLGNSLFLAANLTKNANIGKYSYFGYDIGFDTPGLFSMSNNSGIGKNVIIFGTEMSSSVHIYNKRKCILILGKDPTDGLDDAILTAEAQYFINFSKQQLTP